MFCLFHICAYAITGGMHLFYYRLICAAFFLFLPNRSYSDEKSFLSNSPKPWVVRLLRVK